MAHVCNIEKIDNNDVWKEYLDKRRDYIEDCDIIDVNLPPSQFPCWVTELFYHSISQNRSCRFCILQYSEPIYS